MDNNSLNSCLTENVKPLNCTKKNTVIHEIGSVIFSDVTVNLQQANMEVKTAQSPVFPSHPVKQAQHELDHRLVPFQLLSTPPATITNGNEIILKILCRF